MKKIGKFIVFFGIILFTAMAAYEQFFTESDPGIGYMTFYVLFYLTIPLAISGLFISMTEKKYKILSIIILLITLFYLFFHVSFYYLNFSRKALFEAETSRSSIENDFSINNDEKINWKTYKNDEYLEFQYPENWFIDDSSGNGSISFKKTATTPSAQSFLSFYITDLNMGKDISNPNYVTPQKHFDYYFGSDNRIGINNQPSLRFVQLGKVPVIHHLVSGDNRYIIYTSNYSVGFVLYPGDIQNPSEYTNEDNMVVEEIIKTLIFKKPSESFVRVILPQN